MSTEPTMTPDGHSTNTPDGNVSPGRLYAWLADELPARFTRATMGPLTLPSRRL